MSALVIFDAYRATAFRQWDEADRAAWVVFDHLGRTRCPNGGSCNHCARAWGDFIDLQAYARRLYLRERAARMAINRLLRRAREAVAA